MLNSSGTDSVVPSLPFSVVSNGDKWEVHYYEYDENGRRWERTLYSNFASKQEAEAYKRVAELAYC